jgi:capsular polysaccharide export protein
MLEAALDEHPRLPVLLTMHPNAIAWRKQAHVGALAAGAASRVTPLASNAHPPALIDVAQAVYVITSQMDFEALMWDRPVRCFGRSSTAAAFTMTRRRRPTLSNYSRRHRRLAMLAHARAMRNAIVSARAS